MEKKTKIYIGGLSNYTQGKDLEVDSCCRTLLCREYLRNMEKSSKSTRSKITHLSSTQITLRPRTQSTKWTENVSMDINSL